MPQFSLTLIISQIFWLCACFLVLYYFMSRICLPRIKGILQARAEVISQNSLTAAHLQEKIDQINQKANNLKSNSSNKYQLSIDQAGRQAIISREEALSNLRKKVDKITAESEQKIVNFVKDSTKDGEIIVQNIIKIVSNKIFKKPLR